jgi:hypothetical protein
MHIPASLTGRPTSAAVRLLVEVGGWLCRRPLWLLPVRLAAITSLMIIAARMVGV